jgi:hypothetical protein
VFGGKSLYLPGDNSYAGITETLTDLKWTASGSATIEFRLQFLSTEGLQYFICSQADDSNDIYYYDNQIYMRTNTGGGGSARWSWSPSTDTWYHIAVVKNTSGADDINVYVDGEQLTRTTGSFSTGFKTTTSLLLFKRNNGEDLNGYVDEFRWSGVARWTEDFDPPTTEYVLDGAAYTNNLIMVTD